MTGTEIAAAATAKHIADSINQTLESPLKEVGNYIADKVRYLRYGSLLKIVKKADEKAKSENLHLKMPALKFFVPFCEDASLEDAEADDTISDLWSNLLISACNNTDARHHLYLRILKEITRREAELLISIMEESRANVECTRSWTDGNSIHIFDEQLMEFHVRDLPLELEVEWIIKSVVSCLEGPGVWIVLLTAFDDTDDIYYMHYDKKRENENEGSCQALCSLGLLESFKFRMIPVAGKAPLRLFSNGYRLTPLGVAFYETVCNRNYEKEFATDFESHLEVLKSHCSDGQSQEHR